MMEDYFRGQDSVLSKFFFFGEGYLRSDLCFYTKRRYNLDAFLRLEPIHKIVFEEQFVVTLELNHFHTIFSLPIIPSPLDGLCLDIFYNNFQSYSPHNIYQGEAVE